MFWILPYFHCNALGGLLIDFVSIIILLGLKVAKIQGLVLDKSLRVKMRRIRLVFLFPLLHVESSVVWRSVKSSRHTAADTELELHFQSLLAMEAALRFQAFGFYSCIISCDHIKMTKKNCISVCSHFKMTKDLCHYLSDKLKVHEGTWKE